jgi:hypothetical protein
MREPLAETLAGVGLVLAGGEADVGAQVEGAGAQRVGGACRGRVGVHAHAGGVGSLERSEFPIVGNAVGFVVGLGGYYLTDWLWGDDVEETIREGMGEYGCTDGVGPGR